MPAAMTITIAAHDCAIDSFYSPWHKFQVYMLRLALFMTAFVGGASIFEAEGILARNEAWLVAGLLAGVVLFLIPEAMTHRDPRDLILNLVVVSGSYGIVFKLRPWLSQMINPTLVSLITIFSVLLFAAAIVMVIATRRTNSGAETG